MSVHGHSASKVGMPRLAHLLGKTRVSIFAYSSELVSGQRSWELGGRRAVLQSQAKPPPSDREVGQGGSQQEGLRTAGALDSCGGGVGEGAAPAGDISPGEVSETFQMEKVQSSLWCSLHPPTPTPTHGASSPNICLVTLPVLEACTPECCWGP